MIIPPYNRLPRVLWVGIGCQRNTSPTLIEFAVTQILDKYKLQQKAIASLATIDFKKDEIGIITLAKKWDLPLQTFSPEELNTVSVPHRSQIVKEEVGTTSVAEASALKASLSSNLSENNLKSSHLIVPKHIIRQQGEKGTVTIAIAQLINLRSNLFTESI